jgi:hypothetical protein
MIVYVFFLSFFIQLWRNGFSRSFLGKNYKVHMLCVIGLVLVGMFSELYHQIVISGQGKILLH